MLSPAKVQKGECNAATALQVCEPSPRSVTLASLTSPALSQRSEGDPTGGASLAHTAAKAPSSSLEPRERCLLSLAWRGSLTDVT
jgi:hypothetical protein